MILGTKLMPHSLKGIGFSKSSGNVKHHDRDKPEVNFQCVSNKQVPTETVLSMLIIGTSVAYVAGILVAKSMFNH